MCVKPILIQITKKNSLPVKFFELKNTVLNIQVFWDMMLCNWVSGF